jgi:hypothetical protein
VPAGIILFDLLTGMTIVLVEVKLPTPLIENGGPLVSLPLFLSNIAVVPSIFHKDKGLLLHQHVIADWPGFGSKTIALLEVGAGQVEGGI